MLRGQFTYTACQAEGPYEKTPGWKVKQAIPIDPEQILSAAAVQAAVRPFGSFQTPPVPDLATAADIAGLARCLRLDRPLGPWRSLAHLAAAGRDQTGREAFFAHGLLIELTDRTAPLDPSVVGTGDLGVPRPADLWGATGWLTPFRADAIEAAIVGPPPQLSAASPLDPERREDFVDLHPGQRGFVFAAAERALTGGGPLVVAGMPVEAAMWVSTFTHFLLPTTSWSVSFSTFERAAVPGALLDGALSVIGVPIEDVPGWVRIPGERFSLLDPAFPPQRDGAGYRLHDGSTLPIGAWGALAELVCSSGGEDRVRRSIDELGERLGSGTDRHPLWGLAAAVLLCPDLIDRSPQLGPLACRVATDHFPADGRLDPSTSEQIVDSMLRVSPDPLLVFGGLLRAIDSGPGPDPAIAGQVIRGYLTSLLSRSTEFRSATLPWLPSRLQAPPEVAGQLLTELDGLIEWVDQEPDPAVRGRVVVVVAVIAEAFEWSDGPAFPALIAAVDQRARRSLVPLLVAGRELVVPNGWPPIPQWLWRDVLVDELASMLPNQAPGALLAGPGVLRAVAMAAGPLPVAIVPGQTLRALDQMDGERAAAMLVAGPPNGTRRTVDEAEVLAAAAVLRTILSPIRRRAVPADQLAGVLRHWFSGVPIRAEVFGELIEQFHDRSPDQDLSGFASDILYDCPPGRAAAAVVNQVLRGRRPPRRSVLEWHSELVRPLPISVRLRGSRSYLAQPELLENDLLESVALGQLPPAMRAAGQARLVRWVLLRGVQGFDVQTAALYAPTWLTLAGRPPLSATLRGLYPDAARDLVQAILNCGDSAGQDADDLAAEWVVRATMASAPIPGDPAAGFFAGGHARGTGWADGVRALMRAESRNRDDLLDWVQRVRDIAKDLARRAMAAAPQDQRQEFVETSVDTAERLLEIAGIKGRLRRASPTKRP